MKYKFKKGDEVWANIRRSPLPWRKGLVVNRLKRGDGNIYSVRFNVGNDGGDFLEKDLQEV